MKKPDFIIPGAAKSATTTIAKTLSKIDGVYIPRQKECRYFSRMPGNFKGPGDYKVNRSIIKDEQSYLNLFPQRSQNIKCGDVSPDYLYYYNQTIDSIIRHYDKSSIPTIIIILRNPIERAYSQYLHFVRDLRENLKFTDAIKRELEGGTQNWEWAWNYIGAGLYFKAVSAFQNAFPQTTHIFLYEELADFDPFIRKLLKVINIAAPRDPIALAEKNVSGKPRIRILQSLYALHAHRFKKLSYTVAPKLSQKLKDIYKRKNFSKPTISSQERNSLIPYFRDDINKLSDLINQDLTHWYR